MTSIEGHDPMVELGDEITKIRSIYQILAHSNAVDELDPEGLTGLGILLGGCVGRLEAINAALEAEGGEVQT